MMSGTAVVVAANALASSGAPVIVTISGGLGLSAFTCTITESKKLPATLPAGLLDTSLGSLFTLDALPLGATLRTYGVVGFAPITAVSRSVLGAVNAALAGWVAAGGSLYDFDLRWAVAFACGCWQLRGGESLPGGLADFGKTLLCRP